ncbi:MAG TPA: hypothetical protein ENK21_00845 [Trueperaceae bacterium]|nr:hypothetical protein [Trueperaceae bacterium]
MKRLITLALLLMSFSYAQVSFDMGGDLKTDFGVFFDDGLFSTASTQLDLKLAGEVGSGFFPDASFNALVRGKYNAITNTSSFSIREAYATAYLGDFDLSVGNQKVFWGSVDGFNPVDQINPRDLSNPFVDPEEQKTPIPMLRVVYNSAFDLKLDAVVIPVHVASTLPGARWQPKQAPMQLPPGVQIVGQNPVINNLPEAKVGNIQYGVRASYNLDLLEGADVSASYFHGIRTTPTASAKLIPTANRGQFKVQPSLNYDMYDLIGLDFSVALPATVIRGEFAYTITGDPEGIIPTIQNHSFAAVLGSEYTFAGDIMTVGQIMFDYTAADKGKDASTRISSLLTASYDIDNYMNTKIIWLQNYSDGSGALRPAFTYKFADGVSASADVVFLYGSDTSQFGSLSKNSSLNLSFDYSF